MRVQSYSLLAVLLVMSATATTVEAYEWSNPAGGLFQDGANWSGGVAPSTSGDRATFNLSGNYTVYFNGDVGIYQVGIGPYSNGTIHFDLSGYEFLTGETSRDAIEVGRDPDCSGTVE